MSKKNEQTTYISTTPVETSHLESQLAEHNTAIELIKQEIRQEFLHMKESIDSLAEQFKDMKNQLISGFVTKEEHASLRRDVDELLSLKGWAIRIVVGAIIISLLALIGVRQ